MRMKTGTMTRIGLMAAISVVLSYFPEFVLFPPFYKLDFSFVPVLLAGYSLGLVPGLIVLFIKNVGRLLATDTFGVGQLADIMVGTALLVPGVLLYQRNRTLKGAIIGLVVGVCCMVVIGVAANAFILLPVYMGDGLSGFLEANPGFLWVATAPFNAIKGLVISVVTALLYKRLARFLKRGLTA